MVHSFLDTRLSCCDYLRFQFLYNDSLALLLISQTQTISLIILPAVFIVVFITFAFYVLMLCIRQSWFLQPFECILNFVISLIAISMSAYDAVIWLSTCPQRSEESVQNLDGTHT